MKNKVNLLGILLMTIFLSGCAVKSNQNASSNTNRESSASGIANPASTYCVSNGGQLKIVVANDGSESGLCIFNDGSSCDEWAFYRKECQKGQSLVKYNWKY